VKLWYHGSSATFQMCQWHWPLPRTWRRCGRHGTSGGVSVTLLARPDSIEWVSVAAAAEPVRPGDRDVEIALPRVCGRRGPGRHPGALGGRVWTDSLATAWACVGLLSWPPGPGPSDRFRIRVQGFKPRYPYRFFLERNRIFLQTLNPKNNPKLLIVDPKP
jgi:hypothetical protein